MKQTFIFRAGSAANESDIMKVVVLSRKFFSTFCPESLSDMRSYTIKQKLYFVTGNDQLVNVLSLHLEF